MAQKRYAASFVRSAWFAAAEVCSSRRVDRSRTGDTHSEHHSRLQVCPGDGLEPARGILIGSLTGLVAWILLLLLLRFLVF